MNCKVLSVIVIYLIHCDVSTKYVSSQYIIPVTSLHTELNTSSKQGDNQKQSNKQRLKYECLTSSYHLVQVCLQRKPPLSATGTQCVLDALGQVKVSTTGYFCNYNEHLNLKTTYTWSYRQILTVLEICVSTFMKNKNLSVTPCISSQIDSYCT